MQQEGLFFCILSYSNCRIGYCQLLTWKQQVNEDKKKRVSRLQQLEFQVGRKAQNVLSLQIIQFAIEGIIAIKVKHKSSAHRRERRGRRDF